MPPEAAAPVTATPSTPNAPEGAQPPAQSGGKPDARAKPNFAEKHAERQTQRARIAEVGRSVLGKSSSTPATPSTPAAPQSAAESAAKIEEAGGKVPEQRTNESDKQYELRLSKALTDLQKAQNEAVQHRTRGDKAELRVKELEQSKKTLDDMIARVKADPEYALELAGHTPETIAQLMIEGKIKRGGKYAHLDPAVRERLETLEKKEAEREAEAKKKADEEAAAKEHAEKREADLAWLGERMSDESAKKYSLVQVMPNAQERMLNRLYSVLQETGQQPDFDTEAAGVEQSLEADWLAMLSNEAAVTRLCNLPGARDTLTKVLGVPAREQSTQATPTSDDRGKHTSEEGPRTLTQHVVSEVPTRSNVATDPREQRERVRNAGKAVLAGLRKQA